MSVCLTTSARTTMPAYTNTFELEGHRIQPLGRGAVLRDDRMLGAVNPHVLPKCLDDIRWYTLQQVADRAGVDLRTLVARVKAKWKWADLLKGPGQERVVDVERNGVLAPDGTRIPAKQFCQDWGITMPCLLYRVYRDWPFQFLSQPGQKTRERIDNPSPNAPVAPPTYPAGTKGKAIFAHARFVFRGALDTLPGHAKSAGVSIAVVRYRLRQGATLEQAFDPKRRTRSDKGVPNPRKGVRAQPKVNMADYYDERPVL